VGDEQSKKPRRKPAPKPLRERCDLLDARFPVVVPTLLKMLAAYSRRDENVRDAGSEVGLRKADVDLAGGTIAVCPLR
jgi:hypothetical protein